MTLVKVTVRTGDRAIIAGVIAIGLYEKLVRDDEDLISRRVAAYRKNVIGRLVTDAVVIATALHLCEYVSSEYDVYHHALIRFRRSALASASPGDPHD